MAFSVGAPSPDLAAMLPAGENVHVANSKNRSECHRALPPQACDGRLLPHPTPPPGWRPSWCFRETPGQPAQVRLQALVKGCSTAAWSGFYFLTRKAPGAPREPGGHSPTAPTPTPTPTPSSGPSLRAQVVRANFRGRNTNKPGGAADGPLHVRGHRHHRAGPLKPRSSRPEPPAPCQTHALSPGPPSSPKPALSKPPCARRSRPLGSPAGLTGP